MQKKKNHSVKEELQCAFIDLLSEKPYIDITVTDITKKAEVARVSFYRNFSSINDIAEAIADELINDFINEINPVLSSKDERLWREFLFEFLYRASRKQKNYLRKNPPDLSIIFSKIDKKLNVLHKDIPEEDFKKRYTKAAKMGLITTVMRRWIDDGMKETPEEIIDFIIGIVMKF